MHCLRGCCQFFFKDCSYPHCENTGPNPYSHSRKVLLEDPVPQGIWSDLCWTSGPHSYSLNLASQPDSYQLTVLYRFKTATCSRTLRSQLSPSNTHFLVENTALLQFQVVRATQLHCSHLFTCCYLFGLLFDSVF